MMINARSLGWLLLVVMNMISFVDSNWITGNLCWSMPCMNGGSCFGSAYTYLCVCPINYSGALCENRMGVCQENPCGNRGLCVEKSLTSFECRCYFDYIGPTCEEYITKNGRTLWSSLSPTYTRILFDMLQEAYRTKAKEKSLITSNNGQIDFLGLLFKSTTSTPETSTIVQTTFIMEGSETTEREHIIQAQDIQIDEIFPDISTAATFDEFTEQSSQFDDSTTPETDTTSQIVKNITTITAQTEPTTDNQDIGDSTEQSNIMLTSTWSNDDITTQESTEAANNSTESVVLTTTKPTDVTSSNIDTTTDDDNNRSYASDQTTTSSTNTTIISRTAHSQLLYRLCQQIFSRILPNAAASSAAAAAAARSLSSNSSAINNNTANVLLSWFRKHFNSSKSTTTTSTVPSLMISEIQTSSIPLQRIDMDDALHQMNNYIDNEH